MLSETEKLIVLQELPGFKWQDTEGGVQSGVFRDIHLRVVAERGEYFFQQTNGLHESAADYEQTCWAYGSELVQTINLGYERFVDYHESAMNEIRKGKSYGIHPTE